MALGATGTTEVKGLISRKVRASLANWIYQPAIKFEVRNQPFSVIHHPVTLPHSNSSHHINVVRLKEETP